MSTDSDVMVAAAADHGSVVELTRALVTTPSRGGIDPYEPILDLLAGWLGQRGLPTRLLGDGAGATGLVCEVVGERPGPRWVLDACLDTAPFGDETAWSAAPTSAAIHDGWMIGRGAADSKAGAAIFAHVLARLAAERAALCGTITLLCDVDEHTGRFGGARTYFEGDGAPGDVAGVMIGYPGSDSLIIGGRGVHRVRLDVHGVASHSGGSTPTANAIEKAAHLIRSLAAAELPTGGSRGFGRSPKLTVTAMHGGQGFSNTPDKCEVSVDIRTTPTFDDAAAAELLRTLIGKLDTEWPTTEATTVHTETCWPAYALGPKDVLADALLTAAARVGLYPRPRVAGPSNIGNYLAGLDIPATAGFGVEYIGLHATDERINLASIPAVQGAYHLAARTLLAVNGP